MNRLQSFLVLIFAALVVGLLARVAWAPFAQAVSSALAAVPSMLSAVPGWAWWILFGVAMSLLRPMKVFFLKKGCRTRSASPWSGCGSR